ncbi:beta-chimaerin [Colletotrichum paranaense]|uniref:Beta-chimaerin n=3 Tax=Colletotrichum acutatum species complex TaxID=2707335 RepID=A0AAI9YQ55_9PEZI|nr:beta-chimaerin [Colletotrichum costaricense]XP_060342165.1 beta-chimaerin [Colletotrichum paranaense]XP_060383051.1 beta-chimaerin [Colletotrichum tamarilloi]KAI3537232.1 beta-chimaerin [Colletotrichum filicis]KAK1500844.1 beta-chimaerin [Colletotrichum tamarilloi]KAK1518812.1 beta-chimaerin [Colletotrichum costaricense]KAK1521467.1 beta-chimaerin [Colletotrichum paranaense]
MADLRSPSDDNLPSHNEQRDRASSMSLGNTETAAPSQNGGAATANGGPPAGTDTGSAPTSEVSRQVQEVLSSDIGVATMLNQLKASIASAKEFALFLKKRSHIEESHASSLKKLSRISQETMHQPDHRQGSFAQAYSEMMYIHERMAENGTQFALSLQQMHDDLLELAAVAERSRKGWKANGLAAEHRVAELEAAMRKSKAKYDSLAEEYDRARTGDTSRNSGKMFSLKSKSGPQHEEDLLRKAQGADQDYQAKVQTLQSEKAELIARTRPEAISALQDLVKETDSGLALQMQKFASFNEKLLLSNGLSISPIKGQGSGGGPRSLREAVLAINNEKDLHDYLTSHHSKVANNNGEVKYEKNPILATARQQAMGHQPNASVSNVPQAAPSGSFSGPPGGSNQQQQRDMPPPARPSNFQPPADSPQSFAPPNMPAAQQPRPSSQQQHPSPQAQQHGRSFSTNNMLNQPSQQQQFQSNRNSGVVAPTYNSGGMSSQGPPQLGALPFQTSQSPPPPQQQPQQRAPPPQSQYQPPQQHQAPPAQQYPPQGPPPGAGGYPQQNRQSPPLGGPSGPSPNAARPTFGLSLPRLYERDGLPVPMVVYQCIQAVDLYGLGVEGIYRQSGSLTHINKLKTMFDTDSSNPALDFRNPENFYHDVNSVTGLLKQFLRDLPNPLLTTEHHSELIEAAKQEDDIVRRDSLHAIINSLPDPNYATLRSLTLHLHRVMENSHVNRMNSHNLSVIFGPTVMGTDPATSIADAGWQIKVVDTILQNTYEIFDDE